MLEANSTQVIPLWNGENTPHFQAGKGPNKQTAKLLVGNRRLSDLPRQAGSKPISSIKLWDGKSGNNKLARHERQTVA